MLTKLKVIWLLDGEFDIQQLDLLEDCLKTVTLAAVGNAGINQESCITEVSHY